jgi:uncharacterized phage protein (TIGR01671 family)
MREIKFRAWERVQRRFIYTGPIWKSDFWNMLEADPDVYDIQQYTGLKDNNGKEIYEGDIIRETLGNQKGNFEVVYFPQMACFAGRTYVDSLISLGKEERINIIFSENGLIPLEYEVIGNVYENPELLNPPKKGIRDGLQQNNLPSKRA